MTTRLDKQIADIRAAHEALLGGIAIWKASPSREARARIDEAAIRYEDLMLGYFDPERPFKEARGRPRIQPEATP